MRGPEWAAWRRGLAELRRFDGLGARLSAASVVVLLLVVAVANLVSSQLAAARMERTLTATATSVMARLKIGLVEPVWNLDLDQAARLVEVELADPAVQAAQVVDAGGQVLAALHREDGGEIAPMATAPDDAYLAPTEVLERDGEAIGEIRLWISDAAAQAERRAAARADLITFAGIGLVLVGILNLLLRRWVTVPLGQMSHLLERLSSLRAGERLDDIRRQKDRLVSRHGEDTTETGTLTRALDRFVGLFGELKASNDEALRAGNGLACAAAHLLMLDDNGRVVLVNDAFRDYLARDRPFAEAFGLVIEAGEGWDLWSRVSEWLDMPIAALVDSRTVDAEFAARRGSLSISPISAGQGERIGYVVQWHDETERLARQALERRLTAELTEAVAAACDGDLSRRIDTGDADGVLAVLADEVNTLLASFEEALFTIKDVHDALARGDLTYRLDAPAWRGVFADVRDNANDTIARLAELVSTLRVAAHSVASGASDIREGADELSRRIERQAASLEISAGALREMTRSVAASEKDAVEAADVSTNAEQAARAGTQAITRMQACMDRIGDDSRRMTEIVGLIDSIAFQTNLLALNAAVEAARAGEMGRGFAVVAGEVRALAKRASDNAKDIRSLLTGSAEQVQEGIAAAASLSKSVTSIAEAVEQSAGLARTIREGTTVQVRRIRDVEAAMGELETIAQQNSAAVEETSAASAELDEQSANVLALLSRFALERASAARGDIAGAIANR